MLKIVVPPQKKFDYHVLKQKVKRMCRFRLQSLPCGVPPTCVGVLPLYYYLEEDSRGREDIAQKKLPRVAGEPRTASPGALCGAVLLFCFFSLGSLPLLLALRSSPSTRKECSAWESFFSQSSPHQSTEADVNASHTTFRKESVRASCKMRRLCIVRH